MEIITKKSDSLDEFLVRELMKGSRAGVKDLLIPAGGTPESFYEYINSDEFNELESINLWQIDEILSGHKKDCFFKFFKKHLGKYQNQLVKITDILLPPQNPYFSFLGLGVNGHVAFHEPHISKDFSLGCVELGNETLSYLGLEEGTWGVTFGLKTFLNSEKIFLMVKGKHKSSILERFLKDDPTVPAVHLKQHKGLTLLLDEEVSKGQDLGQYQVLSA